MVLLKNKSLVIFAAAALFIALAQAVMVAPTFAWAEDSTVEMYRLYNRFTGEHFYTADPDERDNVLAHNWNDEGVGWVAPAYSEDPVYRLYNRYAGDHHYTADINERDFLITAGWIDEGVGWYSSDESTIPVYRQYNPNAIVGTHNYTTSKAENDNLVNAGWAEEGVGWYAVKEGYNTPTGYMIMGQSTIPASAMADWFLSKHKTFPSIFASGGCSSIYDFAQIVIDEANAEGVRADVVFCQIMLETGWLQFTGNVTPDMFNFAGLGAIDSDPVRNAYRFENVRMGIRAQVQHLKAYASTAPLNNSIVPATNYYTQQAGTVIADGSRYWLVASAYGLGSAPTVPALSGKWASGQDYGQKIIDLLNELRRRSW